MFNQNGEFREASVGQDREASQVEVWKNREASQVDELIIEASLYQILMLRKLVL